MELISSVPLTSDGFAPYGQVIEAHTNTKVVQANQGTANRFNWLARLQNLRPATAEPNMCVFRVLPTPLKPFRMKLLERHLFSTQAFIPMGTVDTQQRSQMRGYLVIVCLNGQGLKISSLNDCVAYVDLDDKPDFSTLKSFIASPLQAINYNPGTWHVGS